jgi:hypothetical protein
MMLRRLAALLVALAVALSLASAAQAATPIVDGAAHALASDPVYVDPEAEAQLSASDRARLRDEIAKSGSGPVYIAVLPDAASNEAGGSPAAVGQAIQRRLGRGGTYAVVVGNHFRAGPTPEAVQAATDALKAHGNDGVEATLVDFVDRVAAARSGGASGSGGSGGGAAIAILVLAVLVGGALLLSRRRRRREEDAEFAEVKENARDDLVALGDDIRALDLDVQMPGVDPEVRDAYAQAVGAYDRANRAWERARHPQDLAEVSSALEEGRWAMATTKAR